MVSWQISNHVAKLKEYATRSTTYKKKSSWLQYGFHQMDIFVLRLSQSAELYFLPLDLWSQNLSETTDLFCVTSFQLCICEYNKICKREFLHQISHRVIYWSNIRHYDALAMVFFLQLKGIQFPSLFYSSDSILVVVFPFIIVFVVVAVIRFSRIFLLFQDTRSLTGEPTSYM